MLSHFSCVWLFGTLWTVAHQAPLSMGFSRQEYRSGSPCPSPGDLPDLGIKPVSLNISCIGRQVLYHSHHLGMQSSDLNPFTSSVTLRKYIQAVKWDNNCYLSHMVVMCTKRDQIYVKTLSWCLSHSKNSVKVGSCNYYWWWWCWRDI